MNAPIDITGITLRTPRMTLRPWRESDLEDFYAYAKVRSEEHTSELQSP